MAPRRVNQSQKIAFGGIFAGVAVVIMCLGGFIPVATFVCPMLCILILAVVCRSCGNSVAWAWYGSVAILSLLLCADKEAVAIFLVIGYYPILKPKMDMLKFSYLWKALLFNSVILLTYFLLMNLMGMTQLREEFQSMGQFMTVITLLLGNAVFVLMDHLLTLRFFEKK